MRTRLSSSQERMWLLQQLDVNSNAYNIQVAFRFRSRINDTALRRALDALVARHSVLKSVFRADERGNPHAIEMSEFSIPIAWEAAADDWRIVSAPFARVPFDLSESPPIRAMVVACGDRSAMLCMVFHHILVDGYSVKIIARDLSQLYGAAVAGEHAQLPELSRTYSDYASWQRAQIAAPSVEADLEYWRRELDGLTTLDLPLDRLRPASPSTAAAHVEFVFPSELTSKLQAIALRWRCAISSAVAGIFQALLAMHAGQDDIAIGTVLNGRLKSGFNDVVGCFVGTVVLRSQVLSSISFRDLLGTAHRKMSGASAHQMVPFDHVVADLRPERLVGQNPLFDVLFVFQGDRDSNGSSVGEVALVPWIHSFTGFDLELHVEIVDGCLTGTFLYRTELFDGDTMQQLSTRFLRLAEELTKKPDSTLEAIGLVNDADLHALASWNDTAVNVPSTTLTALVERQMKRSPSAEAVAFVKKRLTYAELDRETANLAAALCELGAGPGTVVAVSLPRSVNLIVAVIGVVRSGAAYLPIEPDLPEGRKAMMMAESDPIFVLDEALFGELITHPNGCTSQTKNPCPRDTAYIICTSGSTGKPKAVAVSHEAIVNQLLWMQEKFELGSDDRMLHKTPCSFDVSLWELFWPLTVGATLIIAAPGGHRDPRYLASILRDEKITTVNFVPSMLQVFLAELEPGAEPFTLRRVICAGEVLSTSLQQRYFECISAPLFNLYGPTETTIAVTSWDCAAGREAPSIPIGRPVWNTRAYVLNAGLRRLPVGVAGELYLAGDQLADGYAKESGKTAERFIADPFGPPGSRMYRSGDLARWTADGNLQYHGRIDDQVKLRGVRVELEEISASLADHPAVAQATVAVYEPDPSRQRLVAYVVPDGDMQGFDSSTLAADLRTMAAHRLPQAMVPTDYVFLHSLPVSINDKLDRKALPAPQLRGITGRTPRTPREVHLSELFARTLAIDHVGIDESFFELGGHSLLAVRLVNSIRESFGIDLSIGTLFQTPTVAELNELIGVGNEGDATDVLLSIRASGDEMPIFFVHPGIGLSWCYFGFCSHLKGMPLYGLQSRAVANLERMVGSVSEMAVDYLDQVRSIQNTGPYRLVGWSFGGNVAHAMAGLLAAAGQEVELLVLIDAYPYAGSSPDEATGDARSSMSDDLDIVRRALPPSIDSEIDENRIADLAKIFSANTLFAQRHQPSLHHGDLVFFRASEHPDVPQLRPDAWADFVTGEVRAHWVTAGHFDLLSPEPLAQIAMAITTELGACKKDEM